MAKPPSRSAKPSASKAPPKSGRKGVSEGPGAAFAAQIKDAVAVAEGQPLWMPHRPERNWEKFEGGMFKLDIEGRPFGLLFWRFFLAEGPIATPTAEVVPVDSLSS